MKASSRSGLSIRSAHLLLVPFLLLGGAADALGQSFATVRVEENLRAEPQGVILGRLLQGTRLTVLEVQDRWVQVEVQGWIWTPSLQVTDRPEFDLTVSASPRENLRDEPQGSILARLLEGTLLEKSEEVQGWTKVRRVAWVWAPSLELEEGAGPSAGAGAAQARSGLGELGWWRSGSGGAAILAGPDGDTLAVTEPGTQVQVLDRQGSWARVRLEGWSWAPPDEATGSEGSGEISSATPAEVTRDPDAYRGQVVSWELQFISLEEAERARTDFYEGEPFLLTRTLAPENLFVYVALSRERLGEVEGLIPLERIRVVGRIRTGAAALTGNPILDLVELNRMTP